MTLASLISTTLKISRSPDRSICPSASSTRIAVMPQATHSTISPTTTEHSRHHANEHLLPSPFEPLKWLWKCHICNRTYRLGVTRRCLEDGHFFCAGTTSVTSNRKNGRRTVHHHHRACTSEFDYRSWKVWGTWRRRAMAERSDSLCESEESLASSSDSFVRVEGTRAGSEGLGCEGKDCWMNCDYPSQCRWGKDYGGLAPSDVSVPSSPCDVVAPSSSIGDDARSRFDDILFDDSWVVVDDGSLVGTISNPSDGFVFQMDDVLKTVGPKAVDAAEAG